MIGRPGAGKSFFARQFAETFNAPLVSYDRLRYELFSKPSFSAEEQAIIERLAQLQTNELLKTRSTFIIDGGHDTKASRVKLSTLARQKDYDTLLIWVQTDEPTSKQRSLKRKVAKGEDNLNAPLTEEQYTTMSRRLTDPTSEPHVVISGKHTYTTQARTVLRRLAEARTSETPAVEATPRPARHRPIVIR